MWLGETRLGERPSHSHGYSTDVHSVRLGWGWLEVESFLPGEVREAVGEQTGQPFFVGEEHFRSLAQPFGCG